jgi:hypothetical protein
VIERRPPLLHRLARAIGRARALPWASDQLKVVEFRCADAAMRAKVPYVCLSPTVLEYSCGLAVASHRASDLDAAMYYNTNYPHTDEKLKDYFNASFSKYLGRSGQFEALIEPLQLRAGEYFVSLGILPNQPDPHVFYKYIRCHYRINVVAKALMNRPSFTLLFDGLTEQLRSDIHNSRTDYGRRDTMPNLLCRHLAGSSPKPDTQVDMSIILQADVHA